MNETYYLKELAEQGKLPELLDALGLPSKQFKIPDQGCKIYFSDDHDTNMDCLIVKTWDSDDIHFSALKSVGNDTYKLNDYILLSGIKDPDQKKLQTLYDYMKQHFETYKDDCLWFLRVRQEKMIAEIDKKSEKEKESVRDSIGDKVCRVLGVYR